ncbi:hypothetical protein FRC19_004725 [Serendipita sp. 401]|nr:hypothetical protein FRC19_004725 [Serendipita sp. 401]
MPATPPRKSILSQGESEVNLTPSSKGIGSASEQMKDLRRRKTAERLRGDVEQTQLASILDMFYTFTSWICEDQSIDPKETFETIVAQTSRMIDESSSPVATSTGVRSTASSSLAPKRAEKGKNANQKQNTIANLKKFHCQLYVLHCP